MELKWNLILQDTKTCVCCETKEQAEILLRQAFERGLKWSTGQDFSLIDVDRYEPNHCYYLVEGMQSNLQYSEHVSDTILKFEDVLIKKETKIKFLGEI